MKSGKACLPLRRKGRKGTLKISWLTAKNETPFFTNKTENLIIQTLSTTEGTEENIKPKSKTVYRRGRRERRERHKLFDYLVLSVVTMMSGKTTSYLDQG